MDSFDMDSIKTLLTTTVAAVGLKILAALAFWLIGRWLIGRITAGMRAAMNRSSVDPMLVKYLGSVVGVILNIALVIGILGYFGIETTSFAALLAGAGLAIGAAWSGMLGNFAAGAFMLVLRPFRIGDFVTVAGITGTVHELGLFGTTLLTPDNVLTVIGNGKIFAEVIQNYSAMPVRRVDRTAQLAGGVDTKDAIARLRAVVARIPNVAESPAPEVNLLDMNLVGPVISVRPYTHTSHYWQVYFDTNEAIVQVARDAGWPAPTPIADRPGELNVSRRERDLAVAPLHVFHQLRVPLLVVGEELRELRLRAREVADLAHPDLAAFLEQLARDPCRVGRVVLGGEDIERAGPRVGERDEVLADQQLHGIPVRLAHLFRVGRPLLGGDLGRRVGLVFLAERGRDRDRSGGDAQQVATGAVADRGGHPRDYRPVVSAPARIACRARSMWAWFWMRRINGP